MRVLSKHPPKS